METGVFLQTGRTEGLLLLRIVIAAIVGGLIGWNRHRAGKPAGVGTHALVALGAAIFVSVPAFSGGSHPDALSRVIQGVATGVGFIGAGEIFRDPGPGSRVTGLTTAAALWATAALGVTIVCASLLAAAALALLVLGVLELAPRLERRMKPHDAAPP